MSTALLYKQMDSSEMEARFSNENAIRYDEMAESTVPYEEIKPFISRLPAREMDLIELYYCKGKNQKDIAKIFGVTQGAISSRLARAKKRLQFLRNLPKIDKFEMEEALKEFFEPIEVEVVMCMLETTCQSRTAEILNERLSLTDDKNRMTQVKVRHRFEKCLAAMKSHSSKRPELARYCHLMSFIKKNLYKLHEVSLPHFDRGRVVVLGLTV